MNQSKNTYNKFLLLWVGELISTIGNGITAFGLGIYVLQLTGKVTSMALVTLLAFLPSLLLSAWAGVLADRYDRRTLMIIGDSFSAIGLLYILFCMIGGDASVWQICVGVTISSVFSTLIEPSYRATVTDLLSRDQYTKASGLVQVAGSAKFLISPLIAGFLLAVSDIKLLLLIDIGTFFVTVLTTLVVRKGIATKKLEQTFSFRSEIKEGWDAISKKKGVLVLVIMASVVSLYLGVIQTLSMPMILAFSNSKTVGVIETICACGMLVSSILIGMISIKKGYVKILSLSLFGVGISMILFGFRENLLLICISGFLFFSMLPFSNTCLDYLTRTNIDNTVQGRAWGLIGVISQMGFVIAYAVSGVLVDKIFTPLFDEEGLLVNSVGKIIGTGNGRGAAFLIMIAGLLMCVTSLFLLRMKSLRQLEQVSTS